MNLADRKYGANKALHRTAIPLRSIAASELGRYLAVKLDRKEKKKWELSYL